MSTSRSLYDYPETMDSEQVGELLGRSINVIGEPVRQRGLPAHREPGRHRYGFDRDEVIDWIHQHRVMPED